MALPPDATLGDAGEFGLIGELTALFAQGEQVLVGPGDDAAVLRVKTGHVVVSTDLMVEGRHFRRDWASAEDVGHRAAAQNLSDLNAMGGRAHSLTVGLAAPADLPAAWALDFARGLRRRVRPGRARRSSVATSPPPTEVVIAVTVIGACTSPPVLRSGRRRRRRARAGRAPGLGRRRAGGARPRASARRGCWSRPTGGRSRRTTPGRRRRRPAPPR